jgi:hypothetical protein
MDRMSECRWRQEAGSDRTRQFGATPMTGTLRFTRPTRDLCLLVGWVKERSDVPVSSEHPSLHSIANIY